VGPGRGEDGEVVVRGPLEEATEIVAVGVERAAVVAGQERNSGELRVIERDGLDRPIVQRLSVGEARVVDLTRELGLAQSTVSKHLACLRDCRLIDFRPEGRQSYYFVARPKLLDLLRFADALLAATGEAVALCPVY
jgi:DNA-binding transcriptional ArsR family regulator